MTVIEIRPHPWGWKCFEAPGVEPVFSDQEQATDYAKNRACFRSGGHLKDYFSALAFG